MTGSQTLQETCADDVDRFITIVHRHDRRANGHVALESADCLGDSITLRDSSVLAHSVDRLLEDPSGMTFFIHFLESCDKLNLIKFWIHLNGFKATFEEGLTGSSQKVELSLALLDARNIYERYIDKESACSLSFPKSVSERILERLSQEHITSDIFDEAGNLIHKLFESRYFKEFKNSFYYKKHQLQVFSRWCSLEDVLLVPQLLTAFIEFVDDSHDCDCILFLMAANTFESNYDALSDEELLEDAVSIYDKYFSMQAVTPLHIEDNIRRLMESEICSDIGRPLCSSFLTVKQFFLQRLSEKYLCQFVRSPGYHKYLIELEADIQNALELPLANCEKSCAGSSSSDSFLLSCSRSFESPDYKRLSTRCSQHSPLLTRRDKSFNLAEIDCMGRYRVLYDDSLTQDMSGPSRIRQKLRKYLDKSAVKEEEVALEVARTIIADVHNMVEAGRK